MSGLSGMSDFPSSAKPCAELGEEGQIRITGLDDRRLKDGELRVIITHRIKRSPSMRVVFCWLVALYIAWDLGASWIAR